jgi:uncharacterized protein YbjT (DUF2867 family)
VIGGTGKVGAHVAQALRDRGASVRVLSRPGAFAGPVPAGVEVVRGDLGAPATLASAMGGVRRVLLATPVSRSEERLARNALDAARAAGIEHLVLVSAAGVERSPQAAHLARKAAVERQVEGGGVPFTVIRAADAFQNDSQLRRAICEEGVYPRPIGSVGVSRVDLRDVADAAARLLLEPEPAGAFHVMAGPDELTGTEVARVYSRHVGRTVRYAGDDLAAWTETHSAALGPWLAADLADLFRHLQRHGSIATDRELAAARRLIGHAPRTFEEFAAETAAHWRR